jgi:hypothetical protein
VDILTAMFALCAAIAWCLAAAAPVGPVTPGASAKKDFVEVLGRYKGRIRAGSSWNKWAAAFTAASAALLAVSSIIGVALAWPAP